MGMEDNRAAKSEQKPPRLAWSLKETAEILGLSYPTVWRLINRGKLRAVPGIRHKVIPQKEIDRFLETVEEVR